MRRLLPTVLVAGMLLSLLPAAVASAAPVPNGRLASGQSLYVPMTAVRVLDTRTGLGTAKAAVGPGAARDLQVVGTRVPAGATALVFTLTALGATAPSTFVRAYPTPAAADVPPAVSALTVLRGGVVANQVTVKTGAGGRVRLRNAAGSVHLVVDLAGYYTGSGAGSSLRPSPTARVLDTRVTGGALGPGEVRRVPVGVPTGTPAVVLTVTGLGATARTDVRVYGTRSGAHPLGSALHPAPGRRATATVVVPVGADGSVSVRNSVGRLHLVVDRVSRYAPGAAGQVFAPVAPVRLLDTRVSTPLGPGAVRDLVAAGAGPVPAPGSAVVLNVTGLGPTAPATDVRVYPTRDARVPAPVDLSLVRGQTASNLVLATVGRDGRIRLRNAAGSVHLVVDLAGWYGPSGEGWDISWPQCTAAGATTSRLPVGGAFAVVGLTRGRPFTANECFAAQWAWAQARPGEPSVYLNVNAPGPRSTSDGQQWVAVCGTGQATSTCGQAYGVALARYALARLPGISGSGRPMVWLDVEGPYPGGPYWQSGYPGAVAVNRAVLDGAVETLRASGYRVGIYSDRGTSTANDWRQIMGDYRLLRTQNWVFRSPTADGSVLCTPENSFSGGPVVMVQVQPEQSGQPYDVDHLC